MSEGMFPIVEVSGNAFERGRMHGEQARGRVERSIANYARLFAFCDIAWDAVSYTHLTLPTILRV